MLEKFAIFQKKIRNFESTKRAMNTYPLICSHCKWCILRYLAAVHIPVWHRRTCNNIRQGQ